MTGTSTSAPAGGRRRAFQHPGRFAIVAGGLMLVASIGLIAILSADTETRTQRTPNGAVTDVSPEPNTIVPPQAAVVVDLRDELSGTIEICGPTKSCTPIPEDQLERVKALGRLTFQPGPGKEIARYQPGTNTVVVHLERQTDPGVEIDTYQWSFTSKS
ncbi:MAG: hypothetical protein ACKO2C_07030 [Actinomycetes bacterium]